jgi:hypothetical protein
MQAFGTTMAATEVAGSDGRPVKPADNDPKGRDGTHQVAADTAASSASGEPPKAASTDIVQAVQIASNGDVPPTAPSAGPTAAVTPIAFGDAPAAQSTRTSGGASGATVRSDVPYDGLAGQLRAQPAEAVPSGTEVTSTLAAASNALPVPPGEATTTAQPSGGTDNNSSAANVPAATQPAPPESALAAFYAGRGDAMLAQKDISAARKFYEYAANAGSARAATALARTYDPNFANQLGEVGLRPDPVLAAVWYRKAAELGGQPAQLTQGGDTGK